MTREQIEDRALQAEAAIERIGEDMSSKDYAEYLKDVAFYVKGLQESHEEYMEEEGES